MGLIIKTIFDLRDSDLEQILEECDTAYDNRKERKDKFLNLVKAKIDKLTDESLDRLIDYFEELK
jgi:hypothetical protein